MGTCCTSENNKDSEIELNRNKPKVIFVIGGPGSGKTTQCKLLEKKYGFGNIDINTLVTKPNKYKTSNEKGSIVTVLNDMIHLLKNPITLIDGFPRDQWDLVEWNRHYSDKYDNQYGILFYCSEEIMKYRLMKENTKDVETIMKSVEDYYSNVFPLISELTEKRKLMQFNSEYNTDRVLSAVEKELGANGLITQRTEGS